MVKQVNLQVMLGLYSVLWSTYIALTITSEWHNKVRPPRAASSSPSELRSKLMYNVQFSSGTKVVNYEMNMT